MYLKQNVYFSIILFYSIAYCYCKINNENFVKLIHFMYASQKLLQLTSFAVINQKCIELDDNIIL